MWIELLDFLIKNVLSPILVGIVLILITDWLNDDSK